MAVLPPIEEPPEYNTNYILYWNHAGLELNRLTHSLQGPQTGPTISSRVLGILHLAIHDAYFAIQPSPYDTYLTPGHTDPDYRLPALEGANDPRQAVAGAAIAVLEAFYSRRHVGSNFALSTGEQLDQLLRRLIAEFPMLDALSASYQFGVDVGAAMLALLAIRPDEPGADQGFYRPQNGPYRFRDEPTNPVRLTPVDPNDPDGPQKAIHLYHAPFYGMTARRFAVQMSIDGAPTPHAVADPPIGFADPDPAEYEDAVRDVIRMGGAPLLNKTLRRPDQTVGAYFWAYDGANLIGTPPRLYNQILRTIAWQKKPVLDTPAETEEAANADFARLFALANAAMADAGIFCWREKYCFEFWRPLPGVREHDPSTGPPYPGQAGNETIADPADPFWLTLGAPETNTDRISFKPPFPAYPSGHATFGAAAFQIARLYYSERDSTGCEPDEPDDICFDFVSEELNGVSRDLRQKYEPSKPITEQPGTVRTRVVRHFPSLWAAIFENAISRIWLGVHWRFDAFAAKDALVGDGPPYQVEKDGTTAYKDPEDIRYVTTGPRSDRPGEFPIGGVPLGIGIADDIYQGGLCPTPSNMQPTGRHKCGVGDPPPAKKEKKGVVEADRRRAGFTPKATQTNIR